MRRFLIAILCMALLPLLTAAAQNYNVPEEPIVINGYGDLWTIDPATGEAENITNYGHNFLQVYNGATGLAAYTSTARAWLDTGIERSGPVPVNIWVIDTLTGDAFRVADQPEGASVEDESFVYRSEPTWSPDGALLAWTEYDYNIESEDVYHIVSYNLETRETERVQIPLNVRTMYGVPSPLPVLWSPDGNHLVTWYSRMDDESLEEYVFVFFNPELNITAEVALEPNIWARRVIWVDNVRTGNVELAAYIDNGWLLIDPAAQTVTPYDDLIYGNVADAIPGGLQLVFDAGAWYYQTAVENLYLIAEDDVVFWDNISLSPNGWYLAYTLGDTVTILDYNGEVFATYETDFTHYNLSWGEVRWATAWPAVTSN